MNDTTPQGPAQDFAQQPNAQLLKAWWDLGQVMKRHVAPMLEREHGVDFKDFVALNAIEQGAHYPSLMCDRMAMTPSGISRVVDDLVKRELVKRQLDPRDSRRVRLHITAKGAAVLTAAKSTMLGLLNDALTTLPEERVQQFTATLQHLASVMTHATSDTRKDPREPDSEQERA